MAGFNTGLAKVKEAEYGLREKAAAFTLRLARHKNEQKLVQETTKFKAKQAKTANLVKEELVLSTVGEEGGCFGEALLNAKAPDVSKFVPMAAAAIEMGTLVMILGSKDPTSKAVLALSTLGSVAKGARRRATVAGFDALAARLLKPKAKTP